MPTVYKQAIERIVREKINDPEWMNAINKYHIQLLSGEYPEEYVDIIFQHSWHTSISIYDAYCFAEVHTLLMTGKLVLFAIYLGKTPSSDRQGDEQNRKLSLLSEPFKGEFWGGPGTEGYDGHIEWNRPVRAVVTYKQHRERCWTIVPPGKIGLEVGSTESEKTLFYCSQGGIARWAYGSEYIYVLSDKAIGKGNPNFEKYRRRLTKKMKDEINPYEVMEIGWKKEAEK